MIIKKKLPNETDQFKIKSVCKLDKQAEIKIIGDMKLKETATSTNKVKSRLTNFD